jgi:hypothetical protein
MSDSYDEARKELSQWLAEGKIQGKETIISGGLLAAEQGLADLYRGVNTGSSPSFLRLLHTLALFCDADKFIQVNCSWK